MKKIIMLFLLMQITVPLLFAQDTVPAKVVFYRTKKFAASASDFIIGSSRPDTVFVKLRNGSYHELLINDFRDWDFLGGFFKISAHQKLAIEPGRTYYIQCLLLGGVPVKGGFEWVSEEKALADMKELKPMRKKS